MNKTNFKPGFKIAYGLVLKTFFVIMVVNKGCYGYDVAQSSNKKLVNFWGRSQKAR